MHWKADVTKTVILWYSTRIQVWSSVPLEKSLYFYTYITVILLLLDADYIQSDAMDS